MERNPDIIAEKLIMKYLKNRSSVYFAKIMELYRVKLYGYIQKKTGFSAAVDDIYQETWLKVSRNLENYNSQGKFSNYLFFIATNSCYDYLRKLKREKENRYEKISDYDNRTPDYLENVEGTIEMPGKKLEEYEGTVQIKSLIEKLPEKQKDVVLLRSEGFSFKEISEMTGTSVNSLLSRMRYAIQKIRTGLNLDSERG